MQLGASFSTAFKVAHDLVAVGMIAVTMAIIGVMVNTGGEKVPLYLTSTFLTTYSSDNPALAWSPPTDPFEPARVANTFYSCLKTAGVGASDKLNCTDSDFGAYRDCLQKRTTSTAYISQRLLDGIDNVKKMTDNSNIVQNMLNNLPLVLMNTDGLVPLDTIRSQIDLMYVYLDNIDSSYSRAFKNSIIDFDKSWGINGCLANAEARAGSLDPLLPVYHDLWECASRVLPTTEAEALAFRQCVPLSAWPALDEIQTSYSAYFLGSYNRIFVLLIAAWIATSFVVFTLWLGDSPANAYGKPTNWLARSGLVLSAFCTLWNALGVVLVLIYGFGTEGKPDGFPMTLQTVLLTFVLTVLATGYFARDFWEQASTHGTYAQIAPSPDTVQTSSVNQGFNAAGIYKGVRHLPLRSMQGYARVNNAEKEKDRNLTDDQYTPLLASAWSDVWILVDGLLLLAFLGTTHDVVTAEAGRVFLAVTYAAAAHSALVRFVQEAHMDSSASFKKPAGIDRYELRVVCVICNLVAVFFASVAWALIFNRYGYASALMVFVATTSILPVVGWLILTLCIEFMGGEVVDFYSTFQFVFLLQTLLRWVFVIVAISMATADADAAAALQKAIFMLEF